MRTNGRTLAIVFGVSLALSACSKAPAAPGGGGGGGGGGGASTTVSIPLTDYGGNQTPQFSPTQVIITAGNSVNWLNNDTVSHTTTGENNAWNGSLGPGQSFSRQFTTAGTYSYSCLIHPNMTGRVVVQ